jgi:hypothetical protein
MRTSILIAVVSLVSLASTSAHADGFYFGFTQSRSAPRHVYVAPQPIYVPAPRIVYYSPHPALVTYAPPVHRGWKQCNKWRDDRGHRRDRHRRHDDDGYYNDGYHRY